MVCLRTSLVILLVSIFFYGCVTTQSGVIPRPSPYGRFIMLNGEQKTLSDFRGRPLVLMFWATTCGFSRGAIEDFNELASQYGQQPNGPVFLAVSIDKLDALGRLQERINSRKLVNTEHAFSGNDIYDEAYMSFNVGSIPRIYVIDSQGIIVSEGTRVGEAEDKLEELKTAAFQSIKR